MGGCDCGSDTCCVACFQQCISAWYDVFYSLLALIIRTLAWGGSLVALACLDPRQQYGPSALFLAGSVFIDVIMQWFFLPIHTPLQ